MIQALLSRARCRQAASLAAALVAAATLHATPVLAETRVALVVGNGAYAGADKLPNPPNDAQDIADALGPLGFHVIAGIDVTKVEFDKRLHEFAKAADGADVALFFYAGHGLQSKGVNYLIPVDATMSSESDLDFQTIALEFVLKQMDRAKTKIVFLDACRNNPFARGLARSMGSRALSENSGLAVTAAADIGTFIAYATQPGNVAIDGEGRNSPFTESLKDRIAAPGLSITDLMMEVRNTVAAKTHYAQIPWDHSALSSRFLFKAGATVETDPLARKASDAAEAWGWIKNTDSPPVLQEFVRRYGDTAFGNLATTRLAAMRPTPSSGGATASGETAVISNIKDMTLRPAKPSFDCKVHYKDAEVTICNNPELAILDNELDRLYVRAVRAAGEPQRKTLVTDQRAWAAARDACAADVKCLLAQHQKRIGQLQTGQRSAASAKPARGATPPPPAGTASPTASPGFDCATHMLPAEVAVCGDTNLARLDVDLNATYTRTSRNLSPDRRRVLLDEQRSWLRSRDTCATDIKCLAVQYQARLSQLASWK